MVFTLPSLPSGLSSLIDTSPPVFYPAPTPKRARSRSRSRSTAADSPYRVSTYDQFHADENNASPGPSCLTQHVAEPRRHLGNLLPASVSANDVSGIWEPIPGRGAGKRRQSIAGSERGLGGDPFTRPNSRASDRAIPFQASAGGTPSRPAHRRSQSATPVPHAGNAPTSSSSSYGSGGMTNPCLPHASPMGRLHEFSRNSLASISAVSLPTLAELEMDDERKFSEGNEVGTGLDSPRRYGVGRSVPPSPLVRPYNRPSSRASAISPILVPTSPTLSPSADIPQLAKSPSDSIEGDGIPFQPHRRTVSSVPPPSQAHDPAVPLSKPPLLAHTSPTRASRPPLSPRSWTVQDLHQPFVSSHSRRASIDSTTSVSLSDVAVLATWSFPSIPDENDGKSRPNGSSEMPRGRQPGPSDRLRERLKSLTHLETGSLPASSSAADMAGVGPHGASTCASASGLVKPSRPLPSYLTNKHRHTHSSPNLLQIPGATVCITPPSQKGSMGPPPLPLSSANANPLFPPPRPQRRPTTTKLRQPNPLSMPIKPALGRHQSHASLVSLGGGGTKDVLLSSSPGSMISDSSTLCPSPTSSVKSLPASNASLRSSTSTTASFSIDQVQGKEKDKEKERAWWDISGLGGRSKARSASRSREDDEVQSKMAAHITSERIAFGSGVDDEGEERYIDMDQM